MRTVTFHNPTPVGAVWCRLRSRALLDGAIVSRGMSNRKVALLAGCSPQWVSHLRSGRKDRCTPTCARAIEQALSMKPGALFDLCASERNR